MSLRLALVTRRFWPLVGGAEMAMANLAAEFRRQGHAVRIVTGRWEKHWPLEMVHREVPVTRLPHPRTRAWGTLRYMYALSSWLQPGSRSSPAWCSSQAPRASPDSISAA